MRGRVLGVLMIGWGLIGVVVSFGLWWFLYRYSRSVNEFAKIEIACTSHCGGVDGPFLAGVIASAVFSLIGVTVVVASWRRGRSRTA